MAKTTLQLLIEERAGKDIREVMRDAYRASDSRIIDAAKWIRTTYGTPGPSFAVFSDWMKDLGGRRVLEFSEEETEAVTA